MENKLHRLSVTDSKEKSELKLDGFKINGVKEYEIKNSVDKKVAELSLKIVLKGVDGYIESNEKTAQEGRVQEQLKVTIQPKDRDLLDCKIENIKLLAIKISHELESLPNMYEFKI